MTRPRRHFRSFGLIASRVTSISTARAVHSNTETCRSNDARRNIDAHPRLERPGNETLSAGVLASSCFILMQYNSPHIRGDGQNRHHAIATLSVYSRKNNSPKWYLITGSPRFSEREDWQSSESHAEG